jgi:hypothetical protein
MTIIFKYILARYLSISISIIARLRSFSFVVFVVISRVRLSFINIRNQ